MDFGKPLGPPRATKVEIEPVRTRHRKRVHWADGHETVERLFDEQAGTSFRANPSDRFVIESPCTISGLDGSGPHERNRSNA